VAVDAARAALTPRERQEFDAGLASCQAANFPWWQDEHNYYIDLRVMLPMRWACLQISDRVAADMPDDTLYLFWPELMAVLGGRRTFRSFRSLIQARRQHYAFWAERRPSMPKWLGTTPPSVADPSLREVFGLNRRFLAAVQDCAGAAGQGAAETAMMRGVAAAPGVASGTARVLFSANELHRLKPGEILICESITPSWTFVFDSIAACVCDSGGVMSHAAIIGRDCRVPTVTSVGRATVVVRDGDEIKVDGTTGTVTILRPTRR
jgi:pyruvate,water dikinase